MSSGGARSRSGPAADPSALRRDRAGDAESWRTLPSGGRKGRLPDWPLTKRMPRETTIWRRMWKMPQAVVWEELGQQPQVALYVRRLVEAEKRSSAVNLSTLVRQMEDSLGLTIPGMLTLRWRIEPIEPKGASGGGSVTRLPKPSRSRFKVVPSDGGA